MTLTQLKYFRTIAEIEHLTNAAISLNVSPSAMSRTISMLEREIGFSLFDRAGSKLSLNWAGKVFYEYVTMALDSLGRAVENARAVSGGKRISYFGTTGWLVDEFAAKALIGDYDITTSTHIVSYSEIIRNIINGTCHFGVTTLPVSNEDIRCERLAELPLFAITSEPLDVNDRTCVGARDISSRPIISDKPGTEWAQRIEKFGQRQCVVFNVAYENVYSRRMLPIVSNTNAVLIVPAFVAYRALYSPEMRADQKRNDVFFYLIDDREADVSFFISYPGFRDLTDTESILLEDIRKSMKKLQMNVEKMIKDRFREREA